MGDKKKLRFAALIRVSTEKQEKQGESLRTQTSNNKDSVKFLGGDIVEWYGGQEHATPGYEKKEVDRLVRDGKKRRFDAVIVTDADRWSRDNDKSREGLEVFASHDIRFFVGVTEYNLFDPSHLLFLEMSAVIGKFYARNQKFKSISNRIHRARRGIPTGGKVPFGRKWDKDNERWIIDDKDQALIKDVAKRYLKGEKLPDLAKEYGRNHSNIHKVLMHRSGEDWEIRFASKEFKIDVTIPMKVPRLLDDKTIRALHARAKSNKTFHGERKYEYALSGFVFCDVCGHSLTGQPPNRTDGHCYYRHSSRDGAIKCPVTPRPYIRVADLEEAVFGLILDWYGNPNAIQKAIEEATPNMEKLKELEERRERIVSELKRIERGEQRLGAAILDESITREQAKATSETLRRDKENRTAQLNKLNDQIQNLPTPDQIRAGAEQLHIRLGRKYVNIKRWLKKERASRFETMTFADKRGLIEDVFQGVASDGRPAGVYVIAIDNQPDHRHKRWKFKLLGSAVEYADIDGFYGKTETVSESALY